MAAGIRICLNLNQCRGPLKLVDGLQIAFEKAHELAGVNALQFKYWRFDDGTANVHSDLSESHCSGGTYLIDKHVALEVHMCHEKADNTDLARSLARNLKDVFDPADFHPMDWMELSWKSR